MRRTECSAGGIDVVVYCSDIFKRIKEAVELVMEVWGSRSDDCPFLQYSPKYLDVKP
jgi:hypothetical protein